jgi:glycosyltransferase involved in cell wall biosynthesis
MNSKKYIFIVQVTRQLSIDILNNFISEGAEIELVTGIVEPNYASLDPRIKVRYFNRYDNTSTFKRMFTWSLFTFYSFFYILFRSRKKELILITTPPFIVFLGLFFKKVRNQNYHLIIWDLYPDVLVNFGVLKKTSFVLRIWERLNRSCFNNASTLYTLGKHLSDAIQKYTTNKPIIIPNWVNADFVKPVIRDENTFAKHYNLNDKLVVMYSGNLGLTHDIESIVYTANLLKFNSSIQFVIIGDGAKKAKIEAYIKSEALSNVLLLPYQSKEILPFSLTAADVGIVTLSQGAETISVPSKTYYTLAAGSAIVAIAAEASELGVLVNRYNCGRVFENSPAEKIAEFILYLSENKVELDLLKRNARSASLDFTPKNAKLYYDYICNKLNKDV